ncbi:MAG TPA: mechanosensitive ion channel family protein [Gemmatimonadaceae bacterium]|nr:mechanosensitive ion channel family protein [Gemmatimonadaceae bacterium]
MHFPLSFQSIRGRVAATAGIGVLLLCCVADAPAQGQLGLFSQSSKKKLDTASRTAQAARPETVSPESPRAAVAAFLDLTSAGKDTEAAQYLDLPDSLRTRGPELAREFKLVLDRKVWIDLEDISGAAAGDTAGGGSRNLVQIAELPGTRGDHEPVRLSRVWRGGAQRWLFSRGTVQRIPEWYAALPDRWALQHLPAVLQKSGPLGLTAWQWLAFPVLLVVAFGFGTALNMVLALVFGRVARRTAHDWDDEFISRLAGPVTLGLTVAMVAFLLPWLALGVQGQLWVGRLLKAALMVAFFWGLVRLVDVWRQRMAVSGWAMAGGAARSILPLGSRVAKVAIVAIGVVTVLSTLGFPVAGVLGGLGIGALAFALAAQKTVENLFGAFSIGADQIFREGDGIKVDGVAGTVERVGLRSTRIRTIDRTVVTLPNGKLADSQIESFAVRDRIRLNMVLGLVYETTGAQMRSVLDGLERVLREHPHVTTDNITVRLTDFGASALNVQVQTWVQTTDWNEFLLIRQGILLQFMDVVERAGSGFAFPSQTVYLKR